jgi:hypothetical protein
MQASLDCHALDPFLSGAGGNSAFLGIFFLQSVQQRPEQTAIEVLGGPSLTFRKVKMHESVYFYSYVSCKSFLVFLLVREFCKNNQQTLPTQTQVLAERVCRKLRASGVKANDVVSVDALFFCSSQ